MNRDKLRNIVDLGHDTLRNIVAPEHYEADLEVLQAMFEKMLLSAPPA